MSHHEDDDLAISTRELNAAAAPLPVEPPRYACRTCGHRSSWHKGGVGRCAHDHFAPKCECERYLAPLPVSDLTEEVVEGLRAEIDKLKKEHEAIVRLLGAEWDKLRGEWLSPGEPGPVWCGPKLVGVIEQQFHAANRSLTERAEAAEARADATLRQFEEQTDTFAEYVAAWERHRAETIASAADYRQREQETEWDERHANGTVARALNAVLSSMPSPPSPEPATTND